MAKFLSFYCKSPVPLKPEKVCGPLLCCPPPLWFSRGEVELGFAFHLIFCCVSK